MSRCFSFPPPGYVVSGEALLELIQVMGANAAAEKERKKDKRRKEKEEDELEEGEIRETHKHKRCKTKGREKANKEKKRKKDGGKIREKEFTTKHKRAKNDGETSDCQSLEMSGLTHELEQPITDNMYEICSQDIDSLFRDLIVNWVPPCIHIEDSEFDHQLFKRRRLPRSNTTEVSDACSEHLGHGSSSGYPCAQYLPQADIYALPYTLLF